MPLIYQSPAFANAVLAALGETVNPATTAYRIAVAYVTREGARTLLELLADRVGEAWETLPKTIVTCFDFGHTEPAGLELLQANGFEVRIANLGADGTIRLTAHPSSFHLKVYLAPTAEAVLGVVGSANLSRRAFTVNTEAVSAIAVSPQEAGGFWDEVEANSVELTPELLQRYRDIRPNQRATPAPADEPPVPPLVPLGDAQVFSDAVETGAMDPTEYQAFWVDAGSMRSSGSRHQLELPRRANRFFGLAYDQYDREQRDIGDVPLSLNGVDYARRLVWHGDNRMERLYLPTPAQSGVEYANCVALIQRAGAGYLVTVADAESERAQRWRDESAAAGTLYRVGERSDRWCGLL